MYFAEQNTARRTWPEKLSRNPAEFSRSPVKLSRSPVKLSRGPLKLSRSPVKLGHGPRTCTARVHNFNPPPPTRCVWRRLFPSSFARMIEESMRFAKHNPLQSHGARSRKRISGELLDQACKSTEELVALILATIMSGATIPSDVRGTIRCCGFAKPQRLAISERWVTTCSLSCTLQKAAPRRAVAHAHRT